MAAFEKINSGLAGLDTVIDNIRLGDNVVWQLSCIDEYLYFVRPFVSQAILDNRNLIYMRFAEHPPLLMPQEGLKIEKIDINAGFEGFTVRVHEIIAREGLDAFYVFDCLSELQAEWGTDLMMGNFFSVTCPYLFELDTVAYFAILRNRHSFEAIARIRETTQLLIDVYGNCDDMYVHPLKVWNRYSQNMFLPHKFEDVVGMVLSPLTDGVCASKFYSLICECNGIQTFQSLDNWDKYFIRARLELDAGMPHNLDTLATLCRMLIGREQHLNDLIKEQFNIMDFLFIKERMIGSGSIGGKATGMLLARKIIENVRKDLRKLLEPHDSFYIGSDVFYTYLVQNGWWKLRLRQKTEDGYYSAAAELKEKMLTGVFSQSIKEQFKRMLEYYGQNPIIVRSSSLLEDSFGNAFAGKYESVFCVNVGSPEQRLKDFEIAVKTVYASAMDESALAYRQQRGLDKNDEQMAILVQRVSGSLYKDIFMPCAAGVGYSYNSYVWNKDIDSSAGLVRIVLGLGTRAVDRTDGDYPRLASLDKPQMSPVGSRSEKSKFSQRYIDVLDTINNSLATITVDQLSPKVPIWFKNLMLEHDREAEAMLRDRGVQRDVIFTTCDNLLKNEALINNLREILKTIQSVYKYHVDIEFTINMSESGAYVINLLQCRPLQVGGLGKKVTIPDNLNGKTFFEVGPGCTMGGSVYLPIHYIISVDPREYYLADMNTKHNVARTIGKLNSEFKNLNKTIMLSGPGRWGTSSPELGVPVRFAEISEISVLCEVSYEGAGYMPELSFGSHFFQDLVEAEIFYCAIFENAEGVLFNEKLLTNCPSTSVMVSGSASPSTGEIALSDSDTTLSQNNTASMQNNAMQNDTVKNTQESLPVNDITLMNAQAVLSNADMNKIIKVYKVSDIKLTLLSDANKQKTVCASLI